MGGMDRRTHPGKEDKPIGACWGDSDLGMIVRQLATHSHIYYH